MYEPTEKRGVIDRIIHSGPPEPFIEHSRDPVVMMMSNPAHSEILSHIEEEERQRMAEQPRIA